MNRWSFTSDYKYTIHSVTVLCECQGFPALAPGSAEPDFNLSLVFYSCIEQYCTLRTIYSALSGLKPDRIPRHSKSNSQLELDSIQDVINNS